MWPFRRSATADNAESSSAALRRTRLVELSGEITDGLSAEVIAKLLFLEHEDPGRPITLRIDSPGGSIVAGMAIVDVVRALTPAVRTESGRMAGGIAAAVLASGSAGLRFLGPDAVVSLDPVIGPEGAWPDHRLGDARRAVADAVASSTGQPREVVSHYLLFGRCFTPDEAVEFGLADRVAAQGPRQSDKVQQ